ncbi:MAG: hypothetical protein HC831_23405 [Chloroflexia bacterium]|nr:hypothetical protein [Chloroflexia bacterium]
MLQTKNLKKPLFIFCEISLVVIFLAFANQLLGQNNPSSGTTFNVEVGQYFEQQFTYGGPPVGVWSSTLDLGATGCSMSPSGLLSGYPKQNLNCIDFDVLRDGADAEPYHICIRRPGANIMLVLDKSGSMNQTSGTSTKWGILKECVNSFATSLRSWDVEGVRDSLGLCILAILALIFWLILSLVYIFSMLLQLFQLH